MSIPEQIISRSHSSNSADRTINTGVCDALFLMVDGVQTGGDAELEQSVTEQILESIDVSVSRTSPNASNLAVVRDVPAEFFRRFSNHTGGFNDPVDGAIIELGRHDLSHRDSEMQVSLKWSPIENLDVNADLAEARVIVYREEQLNSRSAGQVVQYLGRAVTSATQTFKTELAGAMREAFYLGENLEKAVLHLGREITLPSAYIDAVSAARYRHEESGQVPLQQLYDADAGYASKATPGITVYTSEAQGRYIEIGTTGV